MEISRYPFKLEITVDIVNREIIKGNTTDQKLVKFVERNIEKIITFPLESNVKLKKMHIHNNNFSYVLIILGYMYNNSAEKSKILDLMTKFSE